ncbi:MAG: hypothetical protein ACYCPX_12555 [Acidiferrobacteraceae bacterium]
MSRLRLSWAWLTDYRARLRFRCENIDCAEPSIIDICFASLWMAASGGAEYPKNIMDFLAPMRLTINAAYRVNVGNPRNTHHSTDRESFIVSETTAQKVNH